MQPAVHRPLAALRAWWLLALAVAMLLLATVGAEQVCSSTVLQVASSSLGQRAPIPVILDTDIGEYFDDSWALGYLISRPDLFDVRLILTATRNTRGRAQVVARYLAEWGRDDIPIGVGHYENDFVGPLHSFGVGLEDYRGPVHEDGVTAAARLLQAEPDRTVVWLGIAPKLNFGKLVQQFPEVVPRLRHSVAMFGSLRTCWNPEEAVFCAEWNARYDITGSRLYLESMAASRALRGADPEDGSTDVSEAELPAEALAHSLVHVVPLDACPMIPQHLWDRLLKANSTQYPLVHSLMITYCLSEDWSASCQQSGRHTMVDSVAVWVAGQFPRLLDHLEHERLHLTVNGTGFTLPVALEDSADPGAPSWPVSVLSSWRPGAAERMFEEVVESLIAYRAPGEAGPGAAGAEPSLDADRHTREDL